MKKPFIYSTLAFALALSSFSAFAAGNKAPKETILACRAQSEALDARIGTRVILELTSMITHYEIVDARDPQVQGVFGKKGTPGLTVRHMGKNSLMIGNRFKEIEYDLDMNTLSGTLRATGFNNEDLTQVLCFKM